MRCASSALRRPRVLPVASTTYQSRWTVSFLAVKVFMATLMFSVVGRADSGAPWRRNFASRCDCGTKEARSEEHTSELQSLMRISYAVFCLKKKKYQNYDTK